MAATAGVAIVVAGSATSAGAAYRADARLADWHGHPTWLAGRSQVSNGELIYDDYIYDDYGPDLNHHSDFPQFRDALAPKSGDFGYPKNAKRYGYNAADLREFRAGADRRGLHFLIALQTMKARNAAIAGIAIDTDGEASTGSGQWPRGAEIVSQGADRFITTWGPGARIQGGHHSHPIHHATSTRRNAIELDVPWRELGDVQPDAKVWIATGLTKHGRGRWKQPSPSGPAPYDAAQGPETYDFESDWGDKNQSSALADGDITQFALDLQPNALRRGETHRFRPTPGYYNRIFRSRYSYGEGIRLKQNFPPTGNTDTSGTAAPMFLGHYQPYGLYIPDGYDPSGKPSQLLLDGHSLDVNHNEYASLMPNQFSQLGDDRDSLIVTPLARGIDTWYLSAGLEDTFEVWRDVRRHYETDPNHTDIAGYSMGGYMTYRLGLLMPDRFARAAVYVGPPAYYYWPYPLPLQSTKRWRVPGNTRHIVENGLNLPYEINHGDLDELVPIGGVVHQVDKFKSTGDPYRFYHHEADDHASFSTVDQWIHTRRWLGHHRRDLSPVRVRYVRYPSMDLDRYGLRFDGAYWVDAVRVRHSSKSASHGEVDATTFALGGHMPKLVEDTPTVSVGEGGASPADVTGQHYEPGTKIERRNAFEAKLHNLAGLTFMSDRMGLHPARPVHAKLTGEDGRSVLRFTGRWSHGERAFLNGSPVPIDRTSGGSIAVQVDLRSGGPSRLRLVP